MESPWHMVVLTTEETHKEVHLRMFGEFQMEWNARGCPRGCTVYADGLVEYGTEVFYFCPRAVEMAPETVRKYAGTPCSSPVGVRLWPVAGDVTDHGSVGFVYGLETSYIPRSVARPGPGVRTEHN